MNVREEVASGNSRIESEEGNDTKRTQVVARRTVGDGPWARRKLQQS